MTMLRHTMLLSFCTAMSLTALPAARAADSDTTTPPVATETTTTCTDGKIWSDEKKECVAPEDLKPAEGTKPEEEKKTERLIDDKLYAAAREFAYAGQYENALKALRAAYDQEDPRILNYMGYNTRKLGNMALGMTYYKRALQKDENYILARSYMGQALIEQGDIEGARVQLVEIRDRGGEGTWAYRALLQSLGGERTTY
ncbi:tetratricopeptide repeat protein [Shinella fusca]|jgi:tetratricopeptide (TPR) repeat protein|uniref:Tetratricopeptide (TPR) repeat protein n=1 Tax=Shinella fusca TaxID=544480 RepID=A0A7W7YUH9_9HYPH|nr:tetratricopeptide (TPR) repeat protein [Shinella fusca]